ncbi:MAG TPA: hypothetical protein VLT83_10385 [Opitutaceae bacterium]|nr:hypothetical protein [Opitutaceae bacterium]
MKPNACLLKPALLAALLGVAGPLLAGSATAVPPPKSGLRTSTDTAKKPEEEGKIAGLAVARPSGGFLGILVEDGKFKISFYDAKKKPVAVDVARATARWPVRYKVFDERTVLNPTADGLALTSPEFVRPPYNFKLYLFLFVAGSDEAAEHYVVDFKQ